MKVLKPPKLNDGDTVGVIAPSHPVPSFQKMYDQGIRNLKGVWLQSQGRQDGEA